MSEELDTDFGSRREARETVLNILYAADNHEQSLTEYLEEQPLEPEEFVSDLVKGISTHLERIDSIINRIAELNINRIVTMINAELEVLAKNV